MSILDIDGQRVSVDRPLEIGDMVKVLLPASRDGFFESPWAEVVYLNADGTWWGRLYNYLVHEYDFDFGDVVLFKYVEDDKGHWWWEAVADVIRFQ